MTRRHLATETEQAKLRAAGWREDNEGWWYQPPDHVGMGWTANEALRKVRKSRAVSEET